MPCRFCAWLFTLGIILLVCTAQAAPPTKPRVTKLSPEDVSRWKETAISALVIALRAPGTDIGRDAVKLYLDSLWRLGEAELWPHDLYEQLDTKIDQLVEGYCGPDDLSKYPEPCGTLISIKLDLRQVTETPMLMQTPREDVQTIALHEAESRLKIWQDIGEKLCLAKNDACPKMAPLLESAAHYFRTARRAGRAMELRRILLDPRYGLDKTLTATGTICNGAKDLEEALLEFDEAASWYERCAREAPSYWFAARDALDRAIELRLLLDDEVAAKRDFEAYERANGGISEHITGLLALAIAEHAMQKGDWKNAEGWLERKRSLFSIAKDTDGHVLFHTYLARIAIAKNRAERAFAEYDEVRRSWQHASKEAKDIGKHGDNVKTLEAVLNAVGEAEFFFAHRTELATNAIRFPPYRGPLEEKPVLRYVIERHKLALQKLRAIERTEGAYLRVIQIEPISPPQWTIASAMQVGQLWARYADEMEDIPKLTGPIPGGHGVTYEELRTAYQGLVGSPPWRAKAKDAFKVCFQWARLYQGFYENARPCEQWLSKYDPSALRAVDEMHDAPSHSAMKIESRPVD